MPSALPAPTMAEELPVGGLGSGSVCAGKDGWDLSPRPWILLVAQLHVLPRLAALIAAVMDTLDVQPCKQCDAPTAIPAY